MRKLSMAIFIAALSVMVVLAGCGGGGGSSSGGGGTTSEHTYLTGTVENQNKTPVKNVTVTVAGYSDLTDASGNFSIDLGANVLVLNLFSGSSNYYFYVSTQTAGTSDYPEAYVMYDDTEYDQYWDEGGAGIPLPSSALLAQGTSCNIGTITVQYNDPDNPPVPPFGD